MAIGASTSLGESGMCFLDITHWNFLYVSHRALLVYPPSLDFMLAFLACLKAGVVAVPVFPPNPARKDTLLMFSRITESCGAQIALTSTEYNHMKKLAGVKDAFSRFAASRKANNATWPEQLIELI